MSLLHPGHRCLLSTYSVSDTALAHRTPYHPGESSVHQECLSSLPASFLPSPSCPGLKHPFPPLSPSSPLDLHSPFSTWPPEGSPHAPIILPWTPCPFRETTRLTFPGGWPCPPVSLLTTVPSPLGSGRPGLPACSFTVTPGNGSLVAGFPLTHRGLDPFCLLAQGIFSMPPPSPTHSPSDSPIALLFPVWHRLPQVSLWSARLSACKLQGSGTHL